MGLLQNGYRDTTGVFRVHGATATNSAYPSASLANFSRPGANRNITAGEGISSEFVGVPVGYLHPNAWIMPQKAGYLASSPSDYITLTEGALTLAAGRNIDAAGTLEISVPDALLQLVVSATGTATLTLTTDANLAGSLSAAGSADFTISVPSTTLGAVIDAIAEASLTLSGDATIRATGALAGDILPYTELSPEALAIEILDLSDVETGLSVREALRLIAAASAGKLSGASGTTITIRNAVADSKNRIVATVDSNGNRTAVTTDLS